MNETECKKLLKKYSNSDEDFARVLAHVEAVKNLALENCIRLLSMGTEVDMDLVTQGALLHDIGYFDVNHDNKPKITHGIIGGEILRKEKLPAVALIAERHIGAGLSKEEIEKRNLPLPKKDFIPVTTEEKIVADADNFIDGTKRISKEEVYDKFKKNVSKEVADKVLKLHDELHNLYN